MGETARLIVSGIACETPCNLCGVTVNKNGKEETRVSITDDLDGSTEVVWEAVLTKEECCVKSIWPPIPMYNGVYITVVGNLYSVIVELC